MNKIQQVVKHNECKGNESSLVIHQSVVPFFSHPVLKIRKVYIDRERTDETELVLVFGVQSGQLVRHATVTIKQGFNGLVISTSTDNPNQSEQVMLEAAVKSWALEELK